MGLIFLYLSFFIVDHLKIQLITSFFFFFLPFVLLLLRLLLQLFKCQRLWPSFESLLLGLPEVVPGDGVCGSDGANLDLVLRHAVDVGELVPVLAPGYGVR